MNANWAMILDAAGNRAYEVFISPVTWLLTALSSHVPALLERLSNSAVDGASVWPSVIALLIWCTLLFVIWRFVVLVRNTIRVVAAWIHLIRFRISLVVRGFKTKLVCTLMRWIPRRSSSGMSVEPDIEMDDLDMAVLQTLSMKGPGFAVSAPDLAEEFRMRPAQIQRRLDRLRERKMLEDVIGSTEGYDNYRLTNIGVSFLTVWNRQHAVI
jgi:hypothetical protein